MPQLGETVAEGKITKWFKSAGDAVKPGDNLFEIETDKVSMEVPSTTTGVLAEIRVAAGEVAPVGAIVAVIADGAGGGASQPADRLPRRPSRHQPPPSPVVLDSWTPEPPGRATDAGDQTRRRRSIRSSRCARPRAITGRRGCRAAPS